ncbi:MAG: UDP-N-acetylglucosamine--N-acetylmuramyl-(pentapeptide) pyrophosphoryl-undecaprenol N-acetylglucosamine transferase [Firmicutes bacterium]|nr:UDP-N-acetylglucosamine--N-acetylmuramyl-(pentapeptide) pyrophosphoryl-undecaprenol N-acetylglucosamine transferase [Bacillota bacterium]
MIKFNENRRVIVLTGGGTAGHVMPNVALLSSLEKEFDEIHYIGSKSGIEREIISVFPNVRYHVIETAKLRRSLSLSNLKTPFKVVKGINQAKKLLQQIKPDVVFSKGGFVSYPVVRAAGKLGIKTIIHESDMSMGLANRMSIKWVDVICTSFEKTAKQLSDKYPRKQVVWTGTPIRSEIFTGTVEVIRGRFGFKASRNLLVMGGSLGASAINRSVCEVLPMLNDWNVLHVTGRGKRMDLIGENYAQVEFMDDIWNAIAWADVVVSRAGSNALCELLALGKSTVFVPLATGRGDQIENAYEVEKAGAGFVINESDLNGRILADSIEQAYGRKVELGERAMAFVKLDGVEGAMELV